MSLVQRNAATLITVAACLLINVDTISVHITVAIFAAGAEAAAAWTLGRFFADFATALSAIDEHDSRLIL